MDVKNNGREMKLLSISTADGKTKTRSAVQGTTTAIARDRVLGAHSENNTLL